MAAAASRSTTRAVSVEKPTCREAALVQGGNRCALTGVVRCGEDWRGSRAARRRGESHAVSMSMTGRT
jgi:hypothetical protein